ncbi:MAG TPA: 30S ribosome-binding factor RbfA [Limnochordia bacterium]|nr:30S ribosome-binding factor RbfA [Limnochordia bacterium]
MDASNPRRERLKEELKREVADILRNMKDPRTGFVTVTDVEISNDLRHLKVFVSIYAEAHETEETMRVLKRAVGFVRTELGQRVRMRHTPEVHFALDTSLAYGARVDALLREIGKES